MRARRLALVFACALLGREAVAAPPPASEPANEASSATLRGRVRVRGDSRAPISGASVIVVDAPSDVRVGKPANSPLDPEAIAWMRQTETDADGYFVLTELPIGPIRVIVVAGGYERLEQWARVEIDAGALELYVEPSRAGPYRTVVETERDTTEIETDLPLRLDGQLARHYPGSNDDPLLAALNLPSVARSPGGLGLISFRGGDPREVGSYLDGHPVPRAFHVIPIASILAPPLVADMQLSPGNYDAAYGGFGGGFVQITSRAGRRDGVHGEAHIDLFDVGATAEGPVGAGSINVGIRRSHVGDVLRLVPLEDLTAPNFWDYFARFDHPLGRGHAISLRGLGAGDRLLLSKYFDFRANFHRFDFDYRHERGAWRVLVSPSLRLDRITLDQLPEEPGRRHARRHARIYSLRAMARWQARDWVALEFGADAVVEHWRRSQVGQLVWYPDGEFFAPSEREELGGAQLRFGAWLSTPLQFRGISLVPAVRVNVFHYGTKPSVRVDPRLQLRARLSPRAALLAAVGMYAIPIAGARTMGSEGAFEQGSNLNLGGNADIPEYLVSYFDPNLDGEVDKRWASATHVTHASLGFEAELPWDLELRALGFWRHARAHEFIETSDSYTYTVGFYGRRKAAGLELLLRRSLASGIVDGWLGYTLLWARTEDQPDQWLPAIFDQRHNFVALLSFALPRGIRVGARFRLGSGNPQTPVVGRDLVLISPTETYHVPLRAPRGTEYQSLFHQLDIRVDKTWTRDRSSVGVYFDVQNVYNRWYPEFWIYSDDWSSRERAIGLPIYPSLGVTVKY